jgi:1-deoxy-D-xylulose-5-phosphate reductoisomerase
LAKIDWIQFLIRSIGPSHILGSSRPLDESVFLSSSASSSGGNSWKSYPAVYNASNEQAVMAFHQGAITFDQITELIERAVDAHQPEQELTLDSLLAAEKWARDRTDAQIAKAC